MSDMTTINGTKYNLMSILRHVDTEAQGAYGSARTAIELVARLVRDFTAETERLRAERDQLRDALSTITLNVRLIPDPAMGGAADIYAVPMDDIEAAQVVIKERQP